MEFIQKMEPKKSNAKLNALLDIEKQIQAKWDTERIFEEDALDEKRFLFFVLYLFIGFKCHIITVCICSFMYWNPYYTQ